MNIKKPKIGQINDITFEEALKINEFYDKRFTENPIKNINDITFNGCNFYKIDFTKIELKNVDIWDSIFEDCDLSNILFDKRSINRCIFKNCRIVGVNFIECSINDLQIINCLGIYLNLYGNKIKNIIIKDTNMKESNFIENKISDLEFDNVDLEKSEINNTLFKGTDFSSCNISGITTDLISLKGIKINTNQAIELVGLLGVEIVE